MLEHSNKPKDIRTIEKQIKQVKNPQMFDPNHHSGKGTRARLNTAAEKHFFSSKYSK